MNYERSGVLSDGFEVLFRSISSGVQRWCIFNSPERSSSCLFFGEHVKHLWNISYVLHLPRHGSKDFQLQNVSHRILFSNCWWTFKKKKKVNKLCASNLSLTWQWVQRAKNQEQKKGFQFKPTVVFVCVKRCHSHDVNFSHRWAWLRAYRTHKLRGKWCRKSPPFFVDAAGLLRHGEMSHKNDDTWTPISEMVVKSHRAVWMGQFACKMLPGRENEGGRKGESATEGEGKKLNGAIAQRAMKWDFLDGNGHGSWIDTDTWCFFPFFICKLHLFSCVKIFHLSFFVLFSRLFRFF